MIPVQGNEELQTVHTDEPPVRDWELLLLVSDSLQSNLSLSDRLNEICRHVCVNLGLERAAIFVADRERDRLRIAGSYGLSYDYVQAINLNKCIPLDDAFAGMGSPTKRAFLSGQVVIVDDMLAEQGVFQWKELALSEGYRSIISIPLKVEGRIVGILNGYGKTVGCFRDRNLQYVLTAIANFLGVSTELAQLYHRLSRQYDLLARSNRIHESLTRLVLEDAGFEGIAGTLSDLLGAETYIFDVHLHLHAAAPPQTVDWVERVRAALATACQRDATALAGGGCVRLPAGGGQAAYHVIPVMAGPERFGYIVACKNDASHLEPLDERALEQAATVVALEFSKLRKMEEVELRVREHFLYELLSEQAPRPAYLRRRAKQCQFPDEGVFQVLLAVARRPESGALVDEWPPATLQTLKSALNSRGHHVLLGEKQGALVLLYGVPAGRQASAATNRTESLGKLVQDTLVRLNGNGDWVQVVLGGKVDDLTRVRHSYRQARKTLDVISRLRRGHAVISYDDLGIYRFIMDTQTPDDLCRFVNDVLGPLLQYDRQRNLGLMATLETYLKTRQALEETGRLLHLHPNTVRYRLQRIAELSGFDPADNEDLLTLQLAMVVWRLIGQGRAENHAAPSSLDD